MKTRIAITTLITVAALTIAACGGGKNMVRDRMKAKPSVQVLFVPSAITHNKKPDNPNNADLPASYNGLAEAIAEVWREKFPGVKVSVATEKLDLGPDYRTGKPAGYKLEKLKGEVVVVVFGSANYFSEQETSTDDEGKNKKVHDLYLFHEVTFEVYDRGAEKEISGKAAPLLASVQTDSVQVDSLPMRGKHVDISALQETISATGQLSQLKKEASQNMALFIDSAGSGDTYEDIDNVDVDKDEAL